MERERGEKEKEKKKKDVVREGEKCIKGEI